MTLNSIMTAAICYVLSGYSITSGKLSDSDTDCPSVIVLGTPHFSSKDGIVGAVSSIIVLA